MMRRWPLPLFVLIATLHVVPIWSVRYLPAGDGAAHVYNAWILHGLITGNAPANIESAYRIDWRPHPNWTGHALMALAMAVVPPLAAEKLLVTLILALLFTGAWRLTTAVDPASDVHAFFVFPFAYAQTLVAGYYNYSLSVGLFLLIVAAWWRRREQPAARTVTVLAVLLVLCYLTHPLATLLACVAVTILSLLDRRPVVLWALLPATVLLALFARTEESNAGSVLELGVDWSAVRLIGTAEVVRSLDDWRQRPWSIGVAVLLAIMAVVTVVRDRRRPANALAAVALAFIAAMFWLPAAAGTRGLVTGRTSQFLFPLLAAWLTPRIGGWWRAILAAMLSVIAIGNLAIVMHHFRAGGESNARFVANLASIEPVSTMLPLFEATEDSGTVVDLFRHRLNYVALEKGLVDYSNYEPGTGYFPIAWRDPALSGRPIDLSPRRFDIAGFVRRADWIVTAPALPYPEQATDLRRYYRLAAVRGGMYVYRRREPLRGPHEGILLPLVGTRSNRGAPGGVRWRIDQRIVNRGRWPVRAVFDRCLEEIPCDFVLAPGEALPIAAATERFALLRVPRASAASLHIDTVVKRADVDRPELSIRIPQAPEGAFRRGAIRIPNVPAEARRVGLRVYVFGPGEWHTGTIRVRPNGGGIVRELPFHTDGLYENASLDTGPGIVDIEVSVGPDVRVWAFATTTDGGGQTHVHLPATR